MILFCIQGELVFEAKGKLRFRTTGFSYLVNKLRESGSIDCVHDITIGYPAGLIQGESDLADGKMPKEGNFCAFSSFYAEISSLFNQTVPNR